MEEKIFRMHGNAEVVDLCKDMLAEAEKGQLTYLAVAAAHSKNKVCFAHAGAYGGVPGTLTGLEMLKGELEEMERRRQSGPRSVKTSANYHEYNCATDPMSFDFAHWLIDAEMIRRRFGAPAPLRVGFRHIGELTWRGKQWLENVLQPMLPMVGAVESEAALGGWRKALFIPTEVVAASKRGEEVPKFKPDPGSLRFVSDWLEGRFPVTITLREARYWEHRNSNLEAWMKFARDLKAKGEDVVFVRDTEKGNEPIEGFHTYPQASFKLETRIALYEQSKCNLFISNGPAFMAVCGSRPYLYFVRLEDHEAYYANRPDWWVQAQGIGDGEQWPWAMPSQRMIWAADSYENISKAWDEHQHLLGAPVGDRQLASA